jgi:hypothetical protein
MRLGTLTGKETRFSHSKHESGGKQALVVGNKAHQRHDDAPGKHDGCEEDPGCQSLQQGIGDWLENGVRYEEDGQRDVVLSALGPVSNKISMK